MTASEIQHRFTNIVVEQLCCDPDDVVADATLRDLGADSLDEIEIIIFCEEDFEINIPDDDAAKLKTVLDCVNYLHAELNRNPLLMRNS